MRGVYLQGPRSSSIGYRDGNTEVRDWSCGGSPKKNLPFNPVNPINPTHSIKHINQKNLINSKPIGRLICRGSTPVPGCFLCCFKGKPRSSCFEGLYCRDFRFSFRKLRGSIMDAANVGSCASQIFRKGPLVYGS